MTEIDTPVDPFQIILYAIAAIASFVLIWSFVLFLIALVGGWVTLARYFPDRNWPASWQRLSAGQAPVFNFSSLTIGKFASYSSVLMVAIDRTGVFIRTIAPFRPGHRPLHIPWQAIAEVTSGRYLFWSIAAAIVTLPHGNTRKLTFWGKAMAEELARQWRQHGR